MSTAGRSAARIVLIVVGVAVIVAVVTRLRQQEQVATETAESIRDQLDNLDPVTRAAVRAKLIEDAAAEVKQH